MSKSSNDILLIGVLGVGAFYLMSRRGAVAGSVAPGGVRPATSQQNAAQWANAIAQGVNALGGIFRGGAGTIGAGHAYYGGNASPAVLGAAQQAQWNDSNPDLNGSIADYVGNDGIAVNIPNNGDPFAWAQYLG